MTEPRFDELIHPSTRLSVVALLAAADWVDFAFVRDQLNLSDSALSKQLTTLQDAGYVSVDRPAAGNRRRVRAQLTGAGRTAFEGHVAALRAIVAVAEKSAGNTANQSRDQIGEPGRPTNGKPGDAERAR